MARRGLGGEGLPSGVEPERCSGMRRALHWFVLCAATSSCTSGTTANSSSDETVCAAGDTKPCSGPRGCDGTRECLSDGSGFSDCACGEPEATAGAGGATAVDAATSAQAGAPARTEATGGKRTADGDGRATGGRRADGAGEGGTLVTDGVSAGSPSTPSSTASAGGGAGPGVAGEGGALSTPSSTASAGGGAGPGVAGEGGAPSSVPGSAGSAGWGHSCYNAVSVDGLLHNEVVALDYGKDVASLRLAASLGVAISIDHKRDVDVADGAGCIARVWMELQRNQGCSLALLFDARPDSSALVLAAASLDADSMCPGWSDSQEGLYVWQSGDGSATLDLSDVSVWDGSLSESCMNAPLRPSGIIVLTRARDSKQVTLDLSDLSVQGAVLTSGYEDACCPGMACAGAGGAAGAGNDA